MTSAASMCVASAVGCGDATSDERASRSEAAQTLGGEAGAPPPTTPAMPARDGGRDPELEELLNKIDALVKESAIEEAARKKKRAEDEKRKFEEDQKAINERLAKDRVRLLELARKVLPADQVAKLDEALETALEGNKTSAIESALRALLDAIRLALVNAPDLEKAKELMKQIADLEAGIQKARDDRAFQRKMLTDFRDEGTSGALGGMALADMLGLSPEKDAEIKLTLLKSKLRELLAQHNPNVAAFNRVQDDIAETLRRQYVHDELALFKSEVDALMTRVEQMKDEKARDEARRELERIIDMIMKELEWNRMDPETRAQIEKLVKEIEAGKK